MSDHNSKDKSSFDPYDELSSFLEELSPNILRIPYRKKRGFGKWTYLQTEVGSYDEFEKCKQNKTLANWSVVTGKLLRGKYKNKYLVCVDLDNKKAIEIFLSFFPEIHSLEELSKQTIVVQHEDAKEEKAHIYYVTEKPITKIVRINFEYVNENIPIFEVKSDSTTLMVAPGSTHPNGYVYKIIGNKKPMVLNEEQSDQLENILTNMHSMVIGSKNGQTTHNNGKFKLSNPLIKIAKELTLDANTQPIIEGSRNNTMYYIALEILRHHYRSKDIDKLREFFYSINQKLCKPPLPYNELNNTWNSALRYQNQNRNGWNKSTFVSKFDGKKGVSSVIEAASEEILAKYHFITLEETREILYYQNGFYLTKGDVLIEKEAEKLFGFEVTNKHITEIKGHIMRRTFRSASEFDRDINIINLQNGLYNISKDELMPHSPNYPSKIQYPITFDPKARLKVFGKYLKDVLHYSEIRTAVEAMAYTFYRDCPFEHYFILYGLGANGKSVFTSLLTELHGIGNVSNVSISKLLDNKFAIADLENKDVNIDSEMSNKINKDMSIIKKLTGGRRQQTRIERKSQQPYDTYIHAKLIFNANSLIQSNDKTVADYRREVIISFPNTFCDEEDDPDLLNKLTSKEELSAIFNMLMISLRRILKLKRIHLNEKTIEERSKKNDITTDPISFFLEETVDDESTDNDYVTKEDFYNAYVIFCRKNKIVVIPKESFGKEIKKRTKYIEKRRGSKNDRKTCWLGVKLKERVCDTKIKTFIFNP